METNFSSLNHRANLRGFFQGRHRKSNLHPGEGKYCVLLLLSVCVPCPECFVLTMGTFMNCIDRKEDTSIVQKKTAMGAHRIAVAMLNGSYCTHPFMRAPSTRMTATKHCRFVCSSLRNVRVGQIGQA